MTYYIVRFRNKSGFLVSWLRFSLTVALLEGKEHDAEIRRFHGYASDWLDVNWNKGKIVS